MYVIYTNNFTKLRSNIAINSTKWYGRNRYSGYWMIEGVTIILLSNCFSFNFISFSNFNSNSINNAAKKSLYLTTFYGC